MLLSMKSESRANDVHETVIEPVNYCFALNFVELICPIEFSILDRKPNVPKA